ncbi:exonuclease domain-containing protein [Vulgatibacter incomptus]|uniref:DNA polymerase III epsilon subunit n=1 Tax=Vulgatibacter incomptus TaxID=1391653 RepID=A0A0K1P9D5_9BACT|nr:exonuclease domain-containing protein [Vulgatibacter incomptus]AKU90036.1 DNA polymerase III epsilon subunit [Vulgatibacter incomptus]
MFVAIDFETANAAASSACSIGLALVEGDAVVDRRYFLIRPTPNVFNRHNVAIHGLTARDVASAPTFAELWPELAPLLEGRLVIAHNAAFDVGVLKQVLDQGGLPYPSLDYACTVSLARRTWSLPRYDLKTVASSLGFEFRHHHALADAEACAQIALGACRRYGAGSLAELLAHLRCGPDSLHDGCAHHPIDPVPQPGDWVHRTPTPRQGALTPRVNLVDPGHPLYGMRVVFTGDLASMDRLEAMQRVVDAGGSYGSAVNGKTRILVVGTAGGAQSTTKLREAEARRDAGEAIQILSEAEFVRLVSERAAS